MKTALSCIFLFLFAMGADLYAQDNIIRIAYNEQLSSDIALPEATYQFINQGVQIKISKEQMTAWVFETPGTYQVKIIENAPSSTTHSCEHHSVSSSFVVLVDSMRVVYRPHTMRLSSAIHKGVDTRGIDVLIDAEVSHYAHRPIKVPREVFTAGIGSHIRATLDASQYVLKEGLHTLRYHLSGVADYSGYIQFDFMTPNGNIIPIGLPTKIED